MLEGTLPKDIDLIAIPDDQEELYTTIIAAVQLSSYKIKNDYLFLQGLQYPQHEHSKQDLYFLPSLSLPWTDIQKNYLKYQRILPYPQSLIQ